MWRKGQEGIRGKEQEGEREDYTGVLVYDYVHVYNDYSLHSGSGRAGEREGRREVGREVGREGGR